MPLPTIYLHYVSGFIFCVFFIFRKKADTRNEFETEPKDLTSRTMFPTAQIKMR